MSLSQKQTTEYEKIARAQMMAAVLDEDRIWSDRELTGNVAYDTMALYFDYMKLPVIGYEAIREVYGDDFGCKEVARLSDITARKVILDGKWGEYKNYPLIAYTGEDHHPVVCIPSQSGGFKAYDLKEEKSEWISSDNQDSYNGEGLICYRPLPRRSLTMRDIWEYASHYLFKADIIALCLMALLSALVGLLMPILNEQLFDKLIPMGSFEAILQVGVVILACSVGNILFVLVKNLCSYRVTSMAKYTVMEALFERLYHLPQSFIDRFGSIDLVSRLLGMTESMSNISSSVITAILGGTLSVLYLIRMFRKSNKLSWAALIMIAIMIIFVILLNRRIVKHTENASKEECEATDSLYSHIAGIMQVRLSGMEDRALYDYQKHHVAAIGSNIQSARIQAYSGVITTIMSALYTIVFYYLVVKKNLDLTIGEFAGFTTAFGLFNSSIMQVVNFITLIPQTKPIIERAKPILEEACESEGYGTSVARFKGEVEASRLTFSYEKDENQVINDISFDIKPGEYVGIVGPSGCGKSTLLKLLLGFEKPTSGNIYYDNKDINLLNKKELRRQMGVVLQDGKLIAGTIYENVALSAPQISQERAKELLIEAGMGPDLERMPMGVLTMVSEFGGSISGGQQQRILIARALANDPCILLFDEATSALDNRAQAVLCDTLAKRNITRIVIAHRLTTVVNCDRILVMNQGKIVEEGTFTELANAGGLFAEMISEQRLYEGDDFGINNTPDKTSEEDSIG